MKKLFRHALLAFSIFSPLVSSGQIITNSLEVSETSGVSKVNGKFEINDLHLNIWTSPQVSNGWTQDGLTIQANPDAGFSTLRVNSNHATVADRGILNVTRSQDSYFYVRTDGNIGIGTTSPSTRLDVKGHTRINKRAIPWRGSPFMTNHLELYTEDVGNSSAYVGMLFHQQNRYQKMLRVNSDGFHFTEGLHSYNAVALYAGGFHHSSDRSLKQDILPLSDALNTVEQLQGVSFVWKNSQDPSIGFIAQEVKEVLPEIVHGEEGSLSVEYANIVAVLVQAVKELRVEKDLEIQLLKDRIALLEASMK